jgi:YHS domain-containing protein
MLRFVVILLVSVLLITLLRAIMGVILRGFSDLLKSGSDKTTSAHRSPDVPVSGELKKDPVCGVFVSTASAAKKSVAGEVVYFCSAECRDKYTG